MKPDDRRFPILGMKRQGASVPWELVLRHQAQALFNHGQTIERLAERGGLAVQELAAVLENKELAYGLGLSEAAAMTIIDAFVGDRSWRGTV